MRCVGEIPREFNLKNLKEVAEKLNDWNIEYFIFFGTVLGFVREKNIIKGDDDVDLYVNQRHYSKIYSYFADGKNGFGITVGRPGIFMQITRNLGNTKTYLDFYFYSTHENHIEERWNFFSEYNKPEKCLHVPNDLIFPLKLDTISDITVGIPAKPEEVCQYLYGKHFRHPLSKTKEEYILKFTNNRPVVTYPSYIIERIEKILITNEEKVKVWDQIYKTIDVPTSPSPFAKYVFQNYLFPQLKVTSLNKVSSSSTDKKLEQNNSSLSCNDNSEQKDLSLSSNNKLEQKESSVLGNDNLEQNNSSLSDDYKSSLPNNRKLEQKESSVSDNNKLKQKDSSVLDNDNLEQNNSSLSGVLENKLLLPDNNKLSQKDLSLTCNNKLEQKDVLTVEQNNSSVLGDDKVEQNNSSASGDNNSEQNNSSGNNNLEHEESLCSDENKDNKWIINYHPSLLEIGCGNGRDSNYFYNRGITVCAMDSCETIIENNIKQNDKIDYQNIDIENLLSIPFSFENIYARFFIHAITQEQSTKMFQDCFQLLHPGGYLYIETRTINDDLYGKGLPGENKHEFILGHYRRFIVPSELVYELALLGYHILHVSESNKFSELSDLSFNSNEHPTLLRVVARKPT